MNEKIENINDNALYLELKRICEYVVNVAWRTNGDIDFNYHVGKTKEFKDEIKKLANVDLDLGWGDEKKEIRSDLHIIRRAGDFNPWYTGPLTFTQIVQSISPLAELIEDSEYKETSELEFLHYFNALTNRLPKPELPKPVTITLSSLHPKIQEHCTSRFNSANYPDAILAAYKVVLEELRSITNLDLDGVQLVQKALSPNNPMVKLNSLISQSDQDEQRGFMQILEGVVTGIRNPKAHDLVIQTDPQKTLSYLSFASLLMQRIDERVAP